MGEKQESSKRHKKGTAREKRKRKGNEDAVMKLGVFVCAVTRAASKKA